MAHLVDVYLEDQEGDNSYALRRVINYGKFLDGKLFKPYKDKKINGSNDIRFKSEFASNPDNIMYS